MPPRAKRRASSTKTGDDDLQEQLEENKTTDADASLGIKTAPAVKKSRKRRGGASTGTKTRVKRNLSRLPEMPLDILFEVSRHFHDRLEGKC